jgi:hypothetical protein
MNIKLLFIVISIIIITIMIILIIKNISKIDFFSSSVVFKAPPSFTNLKGSSSKISEKDHEGSEVTGSLSTIPYMKSLSNINSNVNYEGNVISFPDFFHVNEKWPGCLPRPLYQGTCGSCWGFAAATALSSRFYIESCGLAGCLNYPQINFGSLNNVHFNINETYKFRKLYLTNVFKYIDVDRNKKITKEEWINAVSKYYDLFNGIGTPFTEKHYIVQVLTYILDFQSLGSIDLFDKQTVIDRATEVFDVWKDYSNLKDPRDEIESESETEVNSYIDLKLLEEKWKSEPVSLSAEKIIACCPKCIEQDFTNKGLSRICMGGSLDDAWSILRESGTPTSQCIGYNMDAYKPGDELPTCKKIQGPFYSFCTGYALLDKGTNLDDEIARFENSGIDPVSIPESDKNLPWKDPQLFIFRARNVYQIKNDVRTIQREILERGPITTGFELYPDFQYSFGTDGMGGQFFKKGTIPLGSTKNSLIYKWDGKGESLGGHAITIVGWGTYDYEEESMTPTMTPTMTPSASSRIKNIIKIPYWICLNSWGYNWGTSGFAKVTNRGAEPYRLKKGGYFWMLRGTNECEIENNVVVGQPDIENISYPGIVDQYGWGLPGPDKSMVSYVKQHDTDTYPDGTKFFYDKSLEGGGTYTSRDSSNNKSWNVKSMSPPSPYVLFWNDFRPIYCLGPIKAQMDGVGSDDIVIIDKDLIESLEKIIKIQKNPLITIDDEQMQLLSIIRSNFHGIRVNRAVNNSLINSHSIGSIIKIIPYKGLSITELDKILKVCPNDNINLITYNTQDVVE